MAINEITDADIREYILGQSPAEKAERFDELSFFDQYSERIGAVERDLIDDYVSGRMDPEEKSFFETLYLSSPIRREKVRFAKAFASFTDRSLPPADERPARVSVFDLFRQWRLIIQFGAVAALILIGTLTWFIFREPSPELAQGDLPSVVTPAPEDTNISPTTSPIPAIPPTVKEPTARDNTSTHRPAASPTPRPAEPKAHRSTLAVVLTPALRNSSFQPLRVPAGTTSVEFHLRLETDDRGPFSADVIDLSKRSRVWSGQRLQIRKDRTGPTLTLRIPSRLLSGGEYQISLTSDAKNEPPEKIGDYFFRVAQ